jgi:hypothetical protein
MINIFKFVHELYILKLQVSKYPKNVRKMVLRISTNTCTKLEQKRKIHG